MMTLILSTILMALAGLPQDPLEWELTYDAAQAQQQRYAARVADLLESFRHELVGPREEFSMGSTGTPSDSSRASSCYHAD